MCSGASVGRPTDPASTRPTASEHLDRWRSASPPRQDGARVGFGGRNPTAGARDAPNGRAADTPALAASIYDEGRRPSARLNSGTLATVHIPLPGFDDPAERGSTAFAAGTTPSVV